MQDVLDIWIDPDVQDKRRSLVYRAGLQEKKDTKPRIYALLLCLRKMGIKRFDDVMKSFVFEYAKWRSVAWFPLMNEDEQNMCYQASLVEYSYNPSVLLFDRLYNSISKKYREMLEKKMPVDAKRRIDANEAFCQRLLDIAGLTL